jgi:hypothetical protein
VQTVPKLLEFVFWEKAEVTIKNEQNLKSLDHLDGQLIIKPLNSMKTFLPTSLCFTLGTVQGLNFQKISGGVDICLFIVIAITHGRFSIINNGGGLKLTPQGIMFGGLGKQLGGFNPPAIQTLVLLFTLHVYENMLVSRNALLTLTTKFYIPLSATQYSSSGAACEEAICKF